MSTPMEQYAHEESTQERGHDGHHDEDLVDFNEVDDGQTHPAPITSNAEQEEEIAPSKKKANKLLILLPVLLIIGMGGVVYAKFFGEPPRAEAAVAVMQSAPTAGEKTIQPAPARLVQDAPASSPQFTEALASTSAVTPSNGVGQIEIAAPTSPSAPIPRPTAFGAPQLSGMPSIAGAPLTVASAQAAPQSAPAMTKGISQEPAQSEIMAPKKGLDRAQRLLDIDDKIAELMAQKASLIQQISELNVQREKLKAEGEPKVPTKRQGNQIASNTKDPSVSRAVDIKKMINPSKVDGKKVAKDDGAANDIRNDYLVYAIIDGRAWLTSVADKVNYTLAVDDSLPDGSVVKSLNVTDTKLEVRTTKGLIASDTRPIGTKSH